jgi:hypothetical protein
MISLELRMKKSLYFILLHISLAWNHLLSEMLVCYCFMFSVSYLDIWTVSEFFCFRTVHMMDNSRVQLIQKGHETGTVPFLVSSSWVVSTLSKCTCFSGLHSPSTIFSMKLTSLCFPDAVFRDLEPPLFLHPCPPAVILVCTLLIFLFDTICCSQLFDTMTFSMHLISCFIDILLAPLLLCWIMLI